MNPRRLVLTSFGAVVFSVFGLPVQGDEKEDMHLARLVFRNMEEMPYTAHIRVIEVEVVDVIKGDDGKLARRSYKVTAEVIETFKGEELKRISYGTSREGEVPPARGEYVATLMRDKRNGKYFDPDVAYVLPYGEEMVVALRQKIGRK